MEDINPPVDQTTTPAPSFLRKKIVLSISSVILLTLVIGGLYLTFTKRSSTDVHQSARQPSQASSTPIEVTQEGNTSNILVLSSGISFDIIAKAVEAQVLGETTTEKKNVPVQIFAFEDHNGNGVREPDDNPLGLMPVNIYDSPFSANPLYKINSTDSGWASARIQVSDPYQLVIKPVPTKEYYPTTKPIIVSEKNNFAVVGFEKKKTITFHISVFAFQDTNKDSNFNYDDTDEKTLFLAPFKFYQQNESGGWDVLPNSVSSTDTGWATTTVEVTYPYIVKVEAGDVNNLTPSNKELTTPYNNTTLIFPYIQK